MPERTCGDCSACCTTMAVDAIGKPRGVPCEHLSPARGCGIYETRPAECRTFRCAWLGGRVAPLTGAMRPDRLGAIVWGELTEAGETICVEETTVGGLERPKVRRLIRELAHHGPVIAGKELVQIGGFRTVYEGG